MQFILKTLIFAEIPGAGRFSVGSVSQQTALEILCANMKDAKQLKDAEGDFRDIELWKGLRFDAKGNVSEIDFEHNFDFDFFASSDEEADAYTEGTSLGPGGSMDLQWIPESVTAFCIAYLEISGSVDTAKLPRKLEEFDISCNVFTGEFRMDGLPETMKGLNVKRNALSGQLILADLPRGIQMVYVSNNAFTGCVKMEDLPPRIEIFDAEQNQLCGEISLEKLPNLLSTLDLTHNNFKQDVLVAPSAEMLKYRRLFIDKEQFGKIVDRHGNDVSGKFRDKI